MFPFIINPLIYLLVHVFIINVFSILKIIKTNSNLYTTVHSSIMHNSLKVGAT